MECIHCTRGIDHCHGTLILHADEQVECSDLSCGDLAVVRHDLVIECHTFAGGCGCVVEETVYFAQAS
nr:hypothetical protein [Amycolatopsis anabasis]